MHYFPIEPLLLLVFASAIVALAILVPLGLLSYVYERLGLRPGQALLALTATLLGGYVNIPLFRLPGRRVIVEQSISFFGARHVLPAVSDWPGTIVAINVGGAVIPIALSFYLVTRRRIFVPAALATAIVAAFCNHVSVLVPGAGIEMPVLAPPVVAAIVACLISWREAAALAYVGGNLGALIGADVLNLGNIRALGAPIASIGGAGTFDGVFLTGVLAVLLASLAGGPTRAVAK